MFDLCKVKHRQIFRGISKMDASACMICGHGGHSISRCPELVAPLRDGFYTGGGGGGGHSHDEEDGAETT